MAPGYAQMKRGNRKSVSAFHSSISRQGQALPGSDNYTLEVRVLAMPEKAWFRPVER
jgi:hypothetical protein